MPNCNAIDPLVTPYVDDELSGADREIVAEHARVCPPCHSRIAAERAVRELIHARRDALACDAAPAALRARCRMVAQASASLRACISSRTARSAAIRE